MPIPAIARSAGISDRGLVRKFRQLIGISPKSYSRIVRFQRVLRSFESDPLIEVPDVAIKYGYYDQSHLINDFRQYAGLTPTEFRARNNKITEAFIAND
jgi:AraC-like DNA-binding protein